jgi:hypothetical protein
VSSLIPAFQPLEPAATGMLADRLDGVLARLPGLGVRVSPVGRLPLAVKLLRAIHHAGAYPTAEPDLIRVGNAIKVAFNFARITDVLRPPCPRGLLRSLQEALNGTLDDTGPTAAHRAQSELVFGATLATGTQRPVGAPRQRQERTPDFVADVETIAFSVEVQRPGSAAAVKAHVEEAVGQIRDYYRGYPGLVALDFSDVLPAAFGINDMASAEAAYQGPFEAACTTAHNYLVGRAAANDPGYRRIGVLFCFAESFLWTVPNPHPLPHAALMFWWKVFPGASQGIIVEKSAKLGDMLYDGFQEFGGRVVRALRMP